MAARFTRTVEDFTCGHCDRHVEGDGYTCLLYTSDAADE